jgi:hypothetical protein
MRHTRPRAILAAVATAALCGALAASAGAAPAKLPKLTSWTVKVTNLTTGEPFSAPLWAVHNGKVHIWQVGKQATNGAALIAEDAFAAPLAGLLFTDPDVLGTAISLPPVTDPPTSPAIPPGGSREFGIGTGGKYVRLSMMFMLVRSNDAFSGLDSLWLGANPQAKHGKKVKSQTVLVNAYDAGTEKNNDMAAYIPGPPFGHMFVRDQEAQLIAPHPGLSATGDLAAYRWTDPVARIEITKNK